MKKIFALLVSFVLLVSMWVPAYATFEDIDTTNETLTEAVDLLAYMGVTKGVSETEFGTEQPVTREQFALFVYRLVKGGKDAPAASENITKFTDLEDPTYFSAIAWANSKDIVKGTSATTFEPKGNITLQDAYTMLVRALGYEEDETLSYPYGYIEVAESKNTKLDTNIEVNYTDTLTRGDMAILLYNTFFAETGVAETKQVEREIGTGANATWVLETVTEYPTFCEKYFDVIEVEYQAVATPNFVFGADETTAELGYEAIEFKYVGNEKTDAPAQFYADVEDLRIENADNYIMSHFKMYVTLNKDNAIDKILYAAPSMKTVTTNDITLIEAKGDEAKDYYNKEAKKLSGEIKFENNVAYFYEAPYSYAKPTYPSQSTEDQKKDLRNAKNLKFITMDYTDEECTITIDPTVYDADTLVDKLALVYTDGMYSATFYDVDGDNIYDYIYYTPYSAYIADTDDDSTFEDDGFENEVVYTNEAIITGKKFSDGDYIIGYFDKAANYINVVDVAKVVTGEVTEYTNTTITIGKKTYNAVDAWKYFENHLRDKNVNVYDENGFVIDKNILTNDEFYVYNNVILAYGIVKTYTEYTDNLIIPLDIKKPRVEFNSKTGDDIYYIYVWVDGETKYVPVEVEDIYPAIIENDTVTDEYLEQLCTYEIKNGIYTITSLGYAENEEGEYTGIVKTNPDEEININDILDTNEETQVIVPTIEDATIEKDFGTRFIVSGLGNKIVLKDYSKILVRIYDSENDEYEFVEYNKDTFKASVEETFDTITYIVSNDVDKKDRDNLIILYATVTDSVSFETKEDKNGYRIIYSSSVKADDEGEYRHFYKVLNPYTGKIEVAMSKSSSTKITGLGEPIAENTLVKLTTTGLIDTISDNNNIKNNCEWIVDYDSIDDVISTVTCDETCEDCILEENETLYYVTNDTKICLISDDEFRNVTFSEFSKNSKDLLGYNSKAEDKNGKYTTEYAPFIKAYIEKDTDNDYDYDIVKFIVIIVEDYDFGCDIH